MASRDHEQLDDRGTPVRILRPGQASPIDDPVLALTLARINETVMRPRGARDILLILGVYVLVIAGMAAIGAMLAGKGLPPWVVPGMMAPVIGLGVYLRMRAARRRHARRFVESLLRIGRCPSCGYDLTAAESGADGVCVCPECSAAWKRERIGRAVLPASDMPLRAETPGDSAPVVGNFMRQMRRPSTIVDDRDRVLARADLALPTLDPGVDASRAASARAMLRGRTLAMRMGCTGVLLVVSLLMFLGASAPFLAGKGGPVRLIPLAGCAFIVLIYASMAWRVWTGRVGWVNPTAVRTLKAHLLCASCAGDLTGRTPEADGCTLCPRCGAAWKLAPPHPPTPPTLR